MYSEIYLPGFSYMHTHMYIYMHTHMNLYVQMQIFTYTCLALFYPAETGFTKRFAALQGGK